VFIMPLGVERAKAKDWLAGGIRFAKLTSAIQVANRKGIKFDYAFWYQGYSDAGRPASAYFNDAKSVIKYVTLNLKVQKWIIARGGGCPALTVGGVAAAQTSLGRQPIYGRFLGPDSADLTTSFSSGTCSLNKLGQNKMAELWAQSMREADRLNEIYQKESLLYYFKQH
jgi:hypothetical protein